MDRTASFPPVAEAGALPHVEDEKLKARWASEGIEVVRLRALDAGHHSVNKHLLTNRFPKTVPEGPHTNNSEFIWTR